MSANETENRRKSVATTFSERSSRRTLGDEPDVDGGGVRPSATNTLPGHPGMSRDSAFSYGTSVVPGLTMLAGTSTLSYASLK